MSIKQNDRECMTTIQPGDDTMQAGDVLKKWKYERVVTDSDPKNECEMRRYRGIIYTNWKNGKFVDFAYVTQGFALFKKNTPEKILGGDNTVLPFYTAYFATHRAHKRLSGGDSGYLTVRDPTGNRINCYVDKYNEGQMYCLCDYENRVIENDINLKWYDLNQSEKCEWDANPLSTKKLEIEREFATRRGQLDKLEYEYLERQLPNIQSCLDEGVGELTREELNQLKTAASKKVTQWRELHAPPPEEAPEEDGGLLRWFTSGKQTGQIAAASHDGGISMESMQMMSLLQRLRAL